MRELLRLVDQGVGQFVLREVQAELARTSRKISDLRGRVTYLSICLHGVPAIFCATDSCRATSQPCPTLIMDLPKGKGKVESPENLRSAQAFHTFSSNDALNFSCWYQVWHGELFHGCTLSGYQKEHLEYALLLQLSRDDDSLPQGLLSVYFPGMFRGRVFSGRYFAYEANLYCRSTFHHEGRAFCRRLGVELGRLLIEQPMDLVPFTVYICFPTTTWGLIVSRFQSPGVLGIFSGDVPWTCDSEGHPLINFPFSARSLI